MKKARKQESKKARRCTGHDATHGKQERSGAGLTPAGSRKARAEQGEWLAGWPEVWGF